MAQLQRSHIAESNYSTVNLCINQLPNQTNRKFKLENYFYLFRIAHELFICTLTKMDDGRPIKYTFTSADLFFGFRKTDSRNDVYTLYLALTLARGAMGEEGGGLQEGGGGLFCSSETEKENVFGFS